jgi:hypothetical protein
MSSRTVVAAAAVAVLAPGLIGLTLAAGQTGGTSEVSPVVSPQPEGRFTCRASTVRVTGKGLLAGRVFEPFTANADGNECADEDDGVLNPALALPGGLGTVRVLFASTDAEGRSAEAGVAQVVLTVPGAPMIRADVLTSEARTVCTANGPAFESDSNVVRLQIGATVVEVPPGPQEVAVPGVPLTLRLNQQTTTTTADSSQRVQRALFLDTPLGEVVIAESVADFHNNPCRPPSPVAVDADVAAVARPQPLGHGPAQPRPHSLGLAQPQPVPVAQRPAARARRVHDRRRQVRLAGHRDHRQQLARHGDPVHDRRQPRAEPHGELGHRELQAGPDHGGPVHRRARHRPGEPEGRVRHGRGHRHRHLPEQARHRQRHVADPLPLHRPG